MAKFFGIEVSMEELPILLVFVGLIFIFISIGGKIGGINPLEVSEEKQAGLFLIGFGLLILGLSFPRYDFLGSKSIYPESSYKKSKKIIIFSVIFCAILFLVGFLAIFGFLPIKGDISVSSSPSGASIYLDDIYQGETPKALNNIEQGSHKITLRLAGYGNWSQAINVDADKTIFISQTLTPIPPPEIKINYPSNMAHVKENITGTAKNIPDNNKIWIVVYPHKDKYYPQSEANIQSGGEWSLPQPVNIGSDNDIGLQFDIIAVLVNQQSQEVFKNYYETCTRTNKSAGMDNISDNSKEYSRITVTRV